MGSVCIEKGIFTIIGFFYISVVRLFILLRKAEQQDAAFKSAEEKITETGNVQISNGPKARSSMRDLREELRLIRNATLKEATEEGQGVRQKADSSKSVQGGL